jgi:hypothetical protein
MRIRLFAALLLALAFRAPGFADTVYLTNGRSFEGVVAETTDNEVKITMPGGSLSLPRSHVLKVEKSQSDFAEYLKRKTAAQRGGSAADWLALAQWAKAQGLEQGVREAALAAADLDPRLAGLAPLMRRYGYVLDEQLDRWISYADSMRRRGFVESNGEWISREEHAARVRVQQQEEAQRNAERASARAAQATQAAREAELALAEMELRERLSRRSTVQDAVSSYGAPVYFYPWHIAPVPTPPCHHCGPRPPQGPGQNPGQNPNQTPEPQQSSRDTTFTHVPGSLIPGRFPARSGTSQR